ncbi:MAG: short-chain fatty acyl-CoA regulator family protein, partial [Caulobacterales bacterium]|nr:short-chain fatty acyl-CoA regulator family protein [Caulobacterales bacterium]
EELKELADRSPRIGEAFVRLHAAYREALADAGGLAERLAVSGASQGVGAELAVEEVRDAFHARENHYPELEAAAERLTGDLNLQDGEIYASLSRYLRETHHVAARIMPYDVMGGALRRYDRHSRRLLLSELLEPCSRIFQAAAQLAVFEAEPELDAIVDEARLSSEEARRLYRVGLANYYAAAVMMPYEPFRAAADALRHDMELLARRFSASFEQVAQRLTTMGRPGARGVPFFLIRVDAAGNVSKRFGGKVFPFARSGGACPRWNIHEVFRTPGRVLTELVELPDGQRFVSIARAVRAVAPDPGEPPHLQAVALGCEASHARRIVYADGAPADGAAAPIGVSCRLCERIECRHRARPPLQRRLYIDVNHRGASPFAFRAD